MAKYINPTKIIDLINRAKIQHYSDSYQNLLNQEYGLDDANTDPQILELIRLLIKTLEYEFSLSQTSDITYSLYIKLAKLIRQYDFNEYVVDDTLQSSQIDYVYIGTGASRFIKLLDTPDSYIGQAGKIVIVNESETGLEFVEISTEVPYSFIPVTLTEDAEEIVLTWSTISTKHGLRPIYIDLYEVTELGQVQSTSRVYTEDNGLTYRWYVSSVSPRDYEIRIYGYVPGEVPVENQFIWNRTNLKSDNTPSIGSRNITVITNLGTATYGSSSFTEVAPQTVNIRQSGADDLILVSGSTTIFITGGNADNFVDTTLLEEVINIYNNNEEPVQGFWNDGGVWDDNDTWQD